MTKDNEMIKILFLDTETSGFIKKDLPVDHADQAWACQIGAILTDVKDKDLALLNMMVKPNGREINYHAEKIHGMSQSYLEQHGLEELIVTEEFGKMLRQANLIVGHNIDFDKQYVMHMMERNLDGLSPEARSAFYLDVPSFCTMKDTVVKKYVGAKNKNGRLKFPNLTELHMKLFGAGFGDVHDAMADIRATKNCFFKLVGDGVIDLDGIL